MTRHDDLERLSRPPATDQRVQETFPRIAIVLMSGFSAELLDADRESPPTWELLRKPCTREELAQAIVRVVGGQ